MLNLRKNDDLMRKYNSLLPNIGGIAFAGLVV